MANGNTKVGKVISVNVGLPRTVAWRGRQVTTGIFKEPVQGKVALRRLNLEGDRQADLSVHGGPDMAVYAYPSEHYSYWRKDLPGMELPWGMFGENFSTEGLLEGETNIGDRFRMGSAELQVTQPRMPCYKLGLKFGRDDIVKRFLASRRTGFYFRVLKEGQVEAGDAIELVSGDESKVSVADIVRLYVKEDTNPQLLKRVLELEPLAPSWRAYFQKKLGKPTA